VSRIDDLFDRLDRWRRLPGYQLERRADLFFSLYLPEVLEQCLGLAAEPSLIPEFPAKQSTSNRSDRIDCLAVARDGSGTVDQVVLVELKTDKKSLRTEQFEYLVRAAVAGPAGLLRGLEAIRRATRAKKKYGYLVTMLEEAGLTAHSALACGSIQMCVMLEEAGLTAHSAGRLQGPCRVVLVQPDSKVADGTLDLFRTHGVTLTNISFARFRETVSQYDDPVSRRFAASLERWGVSGAGRPC